MKAIIITTETIEYDRIDKVFGSGSDEWWIFRASDGHTVHMVEASKVDSITTDQWEVTIKVKA